uniref:Uncharacterized protein n=1 Tax=Zooxanthella nutricula TaxID=1333877 RepID=A0A7S2PCE5_9DINO
MPSSAMCAEKLGVSLSLIIELVDPLRLALYIVMDLGWMLYWYTIANLAAIFALLIDVVYLFATWVDSSAGARAHTLCEVFWLAGVTIWMAGDFMCNNMQGPLIGSCGPPGQNFEDIATRVAIYVLGMGLLPLAAFYGACAVGLLSMLDSAEAPGCVRAVPSATSAKSKARGAADHGVPLVGGVLPEGLYVRLAMAPWILKDISWAYEVRSAVMVFGLMTVFIAGDSLRRFGGATMQAQLLWFIGNAVWAMCELVSWMALPGWRVVTGIVFALAACWAVLGSKDVLEAAGPVLRSKDIPEDGATAAERESILGRAAAEDKASRSVAQGSGSAGVNLQR